MSHFVHATRAGSSRARSEDRAIVFEHDETLIIVVADGAGGVGSGALASEAVVAAVVAARIEERPFDPYDLRAWSDALGQVDRALATSSAGGETTAIIAVVGQHGVVGVSAGDSEVWMVGDGRADRLTEQQDRARIGTRRARPTPFHRRAMEGVLVIATDGLFGHAGSDAITASCAASGDVTAIADTLVALPKLRSGGYPDDVTIVVVGTGNARRVAS